MLPARAWLEFFRFCINSAVIAFQPGLQRSSKIRTFLSPERYLVLCVVSQPNSPVASIGQCHASWIHRSNGKFGAMVLMGIDHFCIGRTLCRQTFFGRSCLY